MPWNSAPHASFPPRPSEIIGGILKNIIDYTLREIEPVADVFFMSNKCKHSGQMG